MKTASKSRPATKVRYKKQCKLMVKMVKLGQEIAKPAQRFQHWTGFWSINKKDLQNDC